MRILKAFRRGLYISVSTAFLAVSTTSIMAQSSLDPGFSAPATPNQKTYLVNGLASIMPFVGYGFANLKKKIGEAKHYSYATPVEGRLAIQPAVLAEIRREYKADPNVQINLIGISYGGNIVTTLASILNKEGIPVNYLGVLDGPILAAVPGNVRKVDNFYCRIPGCIGAKVRLTKNNKITQHDEFKYSTTHIGLGNHDKVHARILDQLANSPGMMASAPVVNDRVKTGSIEGPKMHAPTDNIATGSIAEATKLPPQDLAFDTSSNFENGVKVDSTNPIGPPIDLLRTGSIK